MYKIYDLILNLGWNGVSLLKGLNPPSVKWFVRFTADPFKQSSRMNEISLFILFQVLCRLVQLISFQDNEGY